MTERPNTALDAIANDYVDALSAFSPDLRTKLGSAGETELDDYSPDAIAEVERLHRKTLAEVDALAANGGLVDDVDQVTRAAMQERLALQVEIIEAGERFAVLNNIASPLQEIRDTFDLMPKESADDWEAVARRMANVPNSIDSYIASLRHAAAHGKPFPAIRQVEIGIAQADVLAGEESFWGKLANSPDAPAALSSKLATAADRARAAYGKLSSALQELAPHAPAADGVGRERYARFSRRFLGATIDLDETYEWGREELARVIAEQEEVAAQLYGPGTDPNDAMARLDQDPQRQLHGTAALQEWMQTTSDAAVEALAKEHFDIPTPVRRLECCIAPTQNGGIYYTQPSADFSRPGRMWWSVPPGVEKFGTWREKTTVYHEGVPGHHLQFGQAVYLADQLNRWRSLVCWVSGHGEGWALYAERLMADLGYLDDPADRLGMLDAQRMRAARVVLDIGVHLGKPCPQEWGGGSWDATKALPFLQANVNMADGFVRFELDRYLGWPGQAPAYKVGQRLWEQIRDETAARQGDSFNLKDFHRRALSLGSVGLDVLREALVG